MDLTFSDDQQLLVDSARRFLTKSCPPGVVRRIEELPDGHDPDLWADAVALGWAGICLPEEYGGTGAGSLELALIAEQLGWAGYTSPLLHSTTLVALPLAWQGSDAQKRRWLPGLASGEIIGAPALLEQGARDEWNPPRLAGKRTGSGWRLSGRKVLVPFAGISGLFSVSAVLEGAGPSFLLLEASRCSSPERQNVLGGEPLYAISFDGIEVTQEDVIGSERLIGRALEHAAVAASAYAVGLGERALELSVSHARDREQFGRPIGSFQAVAHRCADMRADLDATRWLTRQAAWTLDAGLSSELEVGAAKAWANEALRRVFLNAHQVHGAIGFSLEHDLQLFTRRAKAFELSFGDVALHRRRVAVEMGLVSGVE
jgi:alkylation response protein AidB-like acyl-CoA dehydrogenase